MEEYNLIDTGFMLYDEIELDDVQAIHIKERQKIRISFRISESFNNILKKCFRNYVILNCRFTRFHSIIPIENIEKDMVVKYEIADKFCFLSMTCKFMGVDTENRIIAQSNDYTIKLEQLAPKTLKRNITWISFKNPPNNFEFLKEYSNLFWYIECPNYEQFRVIFNSDIKNLQNIIENRLEGFEGKRQQILTLFSLCLYATFHFALFNDLFSKFFDKDTDPLKYFIDNVPPKSMLLENLLFDDEISSEEIKRTIFPFLEKDDVFYDNPWLYIAYYLQSKILNLLNNSV